MDAEMSGSSGSGIYRTLTPETNETNNAEMSRIEEGAEISETNETVDTESNEMNRTIHAGNETIDPESSGMGVADTNNATTDIETCESKLCCMILLEVEFATT